MLYNKRSLWDIFHLLVGRRELCSWDIFLRAAMHSHHLWNVSKCCSEPRWLSGGIKSRWVSLYISLRTLLLEHGAAPSIPAQAATSASGACLILRKKGGKPSLLPYSVGYWMYHQLMPQNLFLESSVVLKGSQVTSP